MADNLEGRLKSRISQLQIRKAITGSFLPQQRPRSLINPFIAFLVLIWIAFVLPTTVSIIAILIFATLVMVWMGWQSFKLRNERMPLFTTDETAREGVFKKIGLQENELIALLPNLTESEKNLLWFFVQTDSGAAEVRFLPRFAFLAQRSQTLVQTSLVRDLNEDPKIKKEIAKW